MTKYRESVSFDRINFFWIVIDNGRLVMNPTKDDLLGTKMKRYNDTNICPICREEKETDKRELIVDNILYPKNAGYRKETREWLCKKHWSNRNPNSTNSLMKSLRNRRTGNLNYDRQIFGDNCEKLTERLLGAEMLSTKYDKYSMLPLDHGLVTKNISVMIGDKLVDLYGKIPQTKGARISIQIVKRDYSIYEYDIWYRHVENEHGKKFDILILYCMSKDGDKIKRIYIFPNGEVALIGSITISKNAVGKWYKKYRVIDEEFLKKANSIWQKIINE